MKTLDPFSFWPNYSSAMPGFGGLDSSPDPFYCFHTTYHEFKPGLVSLNVQLSGTRASKGELEFRVNGYRADAGMDAILVAGARVSLENVEDEIDVLLNVAALPGVTYAIFCRHTEPSDLSIEDIVITAEETGDDDLSAYVTHHVGTSRYGTPRIDQLSTLVGDSEPSLTFPCSQPMTISQMDDDGFWAGAPPALAALHDPADRWRNAFVYQTMRIFGFLAHGATGLLTTERESPLSALLLEKGCLVGTLEPGQAAGPIDFVIEMRVSFDHESVDLANHVLRAIRTVSRGGLGIFTFNYLRRDYEDLSATIPTQQMIQRATLRIIGHGCDVAQLRFPMDNRQEDPLGGQTPFGLIVRC